MLKAAPSLRVSVFDELRRRHPEPCLSLRRTLERRIRAWCEIHGPEQEIALAQEGASQRLPLIVKIHPCFPGQAVPRVSERANRR